MKDKQIFKKAWILIFIVIYSTSCDKNENDNKFDIQINVVKATDIKTQQTAHHVHKPKQKITEVDSQLELSPTVLATLPATWLANLDYAASLADGDMALELIGQLEAEHTSLARALTTMVHNFQFDKLVNLTTAAQNDKI